MATQGRQQKIRSSAGCSRSCILHRQSFVECLEICGDKAAIFANEFVIQPDFTAAVVGSLDEDEVPVDAAAVAIVRFVVGISRGEMEGTANFFVEEGIEHGMEDTIVGSEGPFPDIACAGIGIEDLIESFGGIAAVGVFDATVLQFEANAFEDGALIAGGGIELDGAIDAVADWGGEDFAVGNVTFTGAGNDWDIADREPQICAWGGDVDLVGGFHAGFEWLQVAGHAGIIGCADIKEEVFEGIAALAGGLSHRGGRIA